MQERARLIIADDHDIARTGLRGMLADQPDLAVVGEAATGAQAVALARSLRPDLALMDVRMPDGDGLSATRAIRQESPATAVVMVTMHENPEYLLEALRAGAAGYVLKDATHDEVLRTVRRVLAGETLLTPNVASRLLKRLVPEERSSSSPRQEPPPHLTSREQTVLRLVADGATNREIASALHLSAGTVKVHVERILAKLGVAHRTQAAVRAIELGLAPRPGPAPEVIELAVGAPGGADAELHGAVGMGNGENRPSGICPRMLLGRCRPERPDGH
jgi:DNA-binding NarL/FixJ family response regulator